MELKEFISETIKQIADGILEGNSYIKKRATLRKELETNIQRSTLILQLPQMKKIKTT